MLLETKPLLFFIYALSLFVITSCGDNVELVIPLEASVQEHDSDASTQETEREEPTSPAPSAAEE